MNPAASVRTAKLIGAEALGKLEASHVLVVGIGGVGSFAAEALARGGVGTLTLLDYDRVAVSNINRQLVALHSTIGLLKTQVMRSRILDINPDAAVNVIELKYTAENADQVDMSGYDYIIDAIDMVNSKIELILRAKAAGKPIISAMGAGKKLDPTQFIVTDLFATENCPLARLMRKRLRKRGVETLEVVFSPESAHDAEAEEGNGEDRGGPPGSISFVPSSAGLVLAGVVIRRLAGV